MSSSQQSTTSSSSQLININSNSLALKDAGSYQLNYDHIEYLCGTIQSSQTNRRHTRSSADAAIELAQLLSKSHERTPIWYNDRVIKYVLDAVACGLPDVETNDHSNEANTNNSLSLTQAGRLARRQNNTNRKFGQEVGQALLACAYFLTLDIGLDDDKVRLEMIKHNCNYDYNNNTDNNNYGDGDIQVSILCSIGRMLCWDDEIAVKEGNELNDRRPPASNSNMSKENDEPTCFNKSSKNSKRSSSSVDPTAAGRRKKKRRLLQSQSEDDDEASTASGCFSQMKSGDDFDFKSPALSTLSSGSSVGSVHGTNKRLKKVLEAVVREEIHLQKKKKKRRNKILRAVDETSSSTDNQKVNSQVLEVTSIEMIKSQWIALTVLERVLLHENPQDDNPNNNSAANEKIPLADDVNFVNPLLRKNGTLTHLSYGFMDACKRMTDVVQKDSSLSCLPLDFQYDYYSVVTLAALIDKSSRLLVTLDSSPQSSSSENSEALCRSSNGDLIQGLVQLIAMSTLKIPYSFKTRLDLMACLSEVSYRCLETLVSLSNENMLASEKLCEHTKWTRDIDPSCSTGLDLIMKVLVTSVTTGGSTGRDHRKDYYDTALFCLGVLTNAVEISPKARDQLMQQHVTVSRYTHDYESPVESNSNSITWVAKFLVDQTSSFQDSLVSGSFGDEDNCALNHNIDSNDRDVNDSTDTVDREALSIAGHTAALLGTLIVGCDDNANGYENEDESCRVDESTLKIRGLVTAEIPQVGNTKCRYDYIIRTLKAFYNFYPLMLEPCQRLISQIKTCSSYEIMSQQSGEIS